MTSMTGSGTGDARVGGPREGTAVSGSRVTPTDPVSPTAMGVWTPIHRRGLTVTREEMDEARRHVQYLEDHRVEVSSFRTGEIDWFWRAIRPGTLFWGIPEYPIKRARLDQLAGAVHLTLDWEGIRYFDATGRFEELSMDNQAKLTLTLSGALPDTDAP